MLPVTEEEAERAVPEHIVESWTFECGYDALELDLASPARLYRCSANNRCNHRDCFESWSQRYLSVGDDLYRIGDGRLSVWQVNGRRLLVEQNISGPDHYAIEGGHSLVRFLELTDGQLCERGVRSGRGSGLGDAQIVVNWHGEERLRSEVSLDSQGLAEPDERGCHEERVRLEGDQIVTASEESCVCARPIPPLPRPDCTDPSSRRWRRETAWSQGESPDRVELRACTAAGRTVHELWVTRAERAPLVFSTWRHVHVGAVEGREAIRVGERLALVWDPGLQAVCRVPWDES
ncbi:MAG: hypothetical protein AAF938_23080 [Myxococcota bacterium]